MSFKKYLLDKTVQITVSIVGFIIAILMLNAFKVENDLKIALTILFFLVATFNIIFDYFRKYKFYKKILNTLDKLDKKYLILEMLKKPNFYDGEIFYQILLILLHLYHSILDHCKFLLKYRIFLYLICIS